MGGAGGRGSELQKSMPRPGPSSGAGRERGRGPAVLGAPEALERTLLESGLDISDDQNPKNMSRTPSDPGQQIKFCCELF